jgi:hypothetical protein
MNVNHQNTKKQLIEMISNLKKSEIIDMMNTYQEKNMKENKAESSIKIEKKIIKVPTSLHNLEFKKAKQNNRQYNNI